MMTPKSNSKIPDFNSIAENALKQRADLKIAKQQVDVAQKNLSVVVRQRIPDLELNGGYAYQTTSLSDDGTFPCRCLCGRKSC